MFRSEEKFYLSTVKSAKCDKSVLLVVVGDGEVRIVSGGGGGVVVEAKGIV